jgi:predicted nucleotidyltransferase
MALLERLKHQADKWPELKLAVLFGSTARGDDRPGSDVDLGLLLEPYSPALRFEAEAQLGRAARRPVHVILLDEAPPLLRFEIAREGVPLLEREEGVWTGFKVKAMLDWWDWAPIARKMNAVVIRRLKERVSRDQALRASDDSASQEKPPCAT